MCPMLSLRFRLLAVMFGYFLFAATSSFPQVASGTITGVVTDPSGAVVPAAAVVLTHVQQDVNYRTTTTSSGLYEIRFLPPGEYKATAEVAGFKTAVNTGLVLLVGQTMRVDFRLEVGTTTQTIEVKGGAGQMLKPESSEISQVINYRQVADLPLNGRNFTDLIALNAGVTTGMQGQVGDRYNLNGQRSDQNMFMLEGVDNINIEGGLVMRPSIDAIQEFQIQTGNFSAEFGRAAGGIIQVQLRSGSNNYHGTVFEFLRNDKLDANGFFNNQVPPPPGETAAPKAALQRNQFGFTFGGPIKKEKLFFFGDYQGSRQRAGKSEIFSVPTALERQGDFRQVLTAGTPLYKNALTGEVYPGCDLNNFTPEACQVLPTSAIDPPAQKIGQYYPLPNIAGNFVPGVGTFNNYAASAPSLDDSNSFDVKIDYRLRDTDSLNVHYSFLKIVGGTPAAFGDGKIGPCIDCGIVLHLLAGANDFRNQNVGLTEIHNFSANVVNEFRAGLNRTYNPFATADGGANLADQVGIANVNVNKFTGGLPWFSFDPVPMWTGTSPFLPFLRGGTAYQFTDNLAFVRGKHRLKAGVDIRRRLDNDFSNFFPRGGYIYAPFFTGNSYADFLTGRALLITQDLLPGAYGIRGIEYGFYFQDDIKVTPRLTFDLGLRYELFPGYVEVFDKNSNLDIARGVAVLAGKNGQPRTFVKTDKNNWAPRFGFAWTPWADGKTVIRGGYGISYWNSNNIMAGNTINPPYTAAWAVFNLNPDTAEAIYKTSDGLPVQLAPTVANFDPNHPAGSWRVVDPNQRSPYTQFFSLGIQRALPWDMVFDVSYVGSRGVKLPGSYEANPTPPGPTSNVDQRRIGYNIMPDVTGASLLTNAFSSNYHSLQAKLEKRFSHGVQLLTTYTWSKSIDNLSGSATTGGGDSNPSGTVQNPFNFNADRARSSFDQTHRFVLAYNYDMPFGKGRAFGANWHPVVNGFLGGWQLNGILTFSTGLPFSVFATSGHDCGCTASDMRADRLGNGNLPKSERKPTGWFDKTAFADPPSSGPNPGDPVGRYGNAGRNIIAGPGMANVDFSVFKKFTLHEKTELQFRGEFFNLFNRTNFFYPSSSENASWQSGGLITRAYPSRIIQVALKLVF